MQRDYQLVCDARDHGSRKAFAALMSLYREPLRMLLLRMTRNTDTADDLTMETFGKAFMQLHRYAPTSTFSAWLYSIGVHLYIDHLRRNRLVTLPLSSLEQTTDGDYIEYPIPSPQPNPEETYMRIERDESLRQIVEQLRDPYRKIVQLRYFEEMSYEEIAEKLNIPLGTVKIRLARAKTLLHSIISKKGGLV